MQGVEWTTVPGLEDLSADELRAAAPGAEVVLRPDALAGHLWVAGPEHAPAVRALRSAQRVVRVLGRWPLPVDEPLATVQRVTAEVAAALPELADPSTPFRVRCKRIGAHPFTSEDVERTGGAGVRERSPRPVRLTGPAVVLRCDVRGPALVVGLEVEAPPREVPPWRQATSLKPALAWGLTVLARPDGPSPHHLLDPFCGGGTVLAEAAARWPTTALYGSDLHARCAEGVQENLGARVTTRTGDARALGEVWPGLTFDTLVTNPPFGERLGKDVDLVRLYQGFLESAARVATSDARLVVLAHRRGAFNAALRNAPWRTRHVRIVELGGLYAGAFVLEPK